MVCVLLELVRRCTQQAFLNLQGRLAFGNAGAVGNAKDVRIDSDGRFAERRVQNDIGRLSANTGQRLQVCACAWYFAVVIINQTTAGLDDVFRFAVEQADCPNVGLQPVDAQRVDIASGVAATGYSLSVALLTLTSVPCADRMTAINNSNGFL